MDHIVCHFEIPADDVEPLAEFYSGLFGWKIEKMPGFEDYWDIKTSESEHATGGGIMKRQSPGHAPMNYVLVESVSDYLERAQKMGGAVVMGKTEIPNVGWFGVIVDPQHNPIGLFEEASD